MADWRVEDHEGRIRDFIGGLKNNRDFDEAAALIKLLAQRGNLIGEPRSKALGEGLFELRGKQIRIFYIFRPGHRIVLLDGLVKKQSQIDRRTLAFLRALQKVVE
jgi:hypothetical protein